MEAMRQDLVVEAAETQKKKCKGYIYTQCGGWAEVCSIRNEGYICLMNGVIYPMWLHIIDLTSVSRADVLILLA